MHKRSILLLTITMLSFTVFADTTVLVCVVTNSVSGAGVVAKYAVAGTGNWTYQGVFVGGVTNAFGIACDSLGNVYVGESAATNRIRKYSPAGGSPTILVTNNVGGLLADQSLNGFHIGPDNKLYLSTAFGTQSGQGIWRVNLDGSSLTKIVTQSGTGYALNSARDFTFSGTDLHVANRNGQNIYVFTNNAGAYTFKTTLASGFPSSSSGLNSIFYDSISGNDWVGLGQAAPHIQSVDPVTGLKADVSVGTSVALSFLRVEGGVYYSSFDGKIYNAWNGAIVADLGVALGLAVNVNAFAIQAQSNHALNWNGNVNGDWNIASTANWTSNGVSSTYANGNSVLFYDTLSGGTNINLTTTLQPAALLVENYKSNYLFSGVGRISGSAGFRKFGTNALTIANTTLNDFAGPMVLGGGILNVTNLANGGAPSAIGASSANPSNLAFGGGTLSYSGPPVAIDRGYSVIGGGTIMTAAGPGVGTSTLDLQSDVTFGGVVTASSGAGAGSFAKIGPGRLIYTGVGTNTLTVANTAGCYNVMNGTVVFDGVGGQTNVITGEMWVGSTTNTAGYVILTNGAVVNISSWLAIGRGNGSNGFQSSVSLYDSTLTCSQLSLGYFNNLSNQVSPVLNLFGNSIFNNAGSSCNISESSGSTSTVVVSNNSSFTTASALRLGMSTNAVGNLFIAGNGRVTNNAFISIGQNGGGMGVVSVRDNGYLRVTGDFNVSDNATTIGALNIQDNSLVEFASTTAANAFYCGKGANSTGTVNQAGGTLKRVGSATGDWRLANTAGAVGIYNFSGGVLDLGNINLHIGASGTGIFNQNGGTTTVGMFASVGRFAGAIGVMTVSGGDFYQTNVAGALIVGELGAGTLTITNNGYVEVRSTASGLVIGNGSTGAGLVNLDGGILTAPFVQRLNGSGTFNFNGGILRATNANTSFVANTLTTVNVNAGGAIIDSAGYNIAVQKPLLDGGGGGGLIKRGAGTLTLASNNTYTGSTTINNGTLALGGSGSIANSPMIFVASGATFDASAVSGFALSASQTLVGGGSVNGAATLNGTMAPGPSIGTLTFSNAPVLNGVIVVEINQTNSQSADRMVLASGVLTYGGTLVVTNIGPVVTNGSFTLFSAPSYSGAFSSVVLPLGGVGHWKTNNLIVDGTITFTNTAPVAQNLTLGVSRGGSISLLIIGGKNEPMDADGDSITVTGVSAANSGTSGFTATGVTYVADGAAGTNTFTYTVMDTMGATDTKTVTVVVNDPQGFNQVSAGVDGGNAVLSYLGIPGFSYALDVTHELPATNWAAVSTNTAAVNGYLYFTNPVSMSPTNDYYRTRYVP